MAAANLTWREKCVNEFGLMEFPDGWKNERLFKLSSANDDTWKNYHKYRTQHNPISKKAPSDYEDDHDGSLFLWKEIKVALQKEAKDIIYEERMEATSSSQKNSATAVTAQSWLKHTAQEIFDVCWVDTDELRSVQYCAYVYSPYAIPHAVELSFRYHNRTRWSSVEFYCQWEFKLVRFDENTNPKGGDAMQVELAKKFPATFQYGQDSPCIFFSDTGYELLCANSFFDPPYIDEKRGIGWKAVENIDISNFNPTTVWRIREWIFGSAHKSMDSLDDFSFLRLLFASFGTAEFQIDKGTLGYEWQAWTSPYHEEIEQIDKDYSGLTWLEYQARLVAGKLRPVDRYYQPYDILEAKSYWGQQVLDAEERSPNRMDEEEDERLPWMVWDDAMKSGGMGGGAGHEAMMMAMLKMMGGR